MVWIAGGFGGTATTGCTATTVLPGQDSDLPVPDASVADDRGEAPCEPGDCGAGEVCINGHCALALQDGDGDGVRAAADCDDNDARAGTAAERACEGDCGGGIERCVMGEWSECDAPTGSQCACLTGERRTLDCTMCGVQRQRCTDGRWEDDGACVEQGACSPGQVELGESCGNCGTQRRRCTDECRWGPWECVDEGVCEPGRTEAESQGCGVCGEEQSRRRNCTSSCEWSEWSEWGACSDSGGCQPGSTDHETRSCSTECGSGVRERSRGCDSGCSWGSWSLWSSCQITNYNEEVCNLEDDDCNGRCDDAPLGCRHAIGRAWSASRTAHYYWDTRTESPPGDYRVEDAEYFFLYDDDAGPLTVPFYRCELRAGESATDHHFLYTTSSNCEGTGVPRTLLGYISATDAGCGSQRIWRMFKGATTDHFLAKSEGELQSAGDLGYTLEEAAWWAF